MANEPAEEARDRRVEELVIFYRALLRSVYGGRRWVLALDIMAGLTGLAAALQDLGATEALCIAASRGLGPLPDRDFAAIQLTVGAGQADSLMDGLRKALDRLADLPAEVVAQVDAFDPLHECPVIGAFFGDDRKIAGRRVWAARPERWRALEDKTLIDAFWDRLGVPREPSEVLSARDLEGLLHASDQLDRYGDGVVWVGDNKEGFHGAAEYLRWVRNRAEGVRALEFFAAHCDQVRVMPFLEGVPCSIHGVVFADDQIALRPCEMVVLRKTGTSTFHYAGSATFWDPDPRDRQEMRQMTYRVGRALREEYDYRGVFTIDGIMTSHGFRPTELNPRFGGAIGQLGERIPELPLVLLHFAIVESDELDWRPRDLEGLLLDLGDRYRAGGAMATLTKPIEQATTCGVVLSSGTPQLLDDPDDPRSEWTAHLGPGPTGGFLRVVPRFDTIPRGPSYAPKAALVLTYLDQAWALGLGDLQPARELR